MDITNRNIIRLGLILLGVMLAILIGFSSSASPVNYSIEIVLKDLISIEESIMKPVMSMLVKVNSIIYHLFN